MAEQSQTQSRAYRGPVRRLRVTVTDGAWQVRKETRVDRMTLRRSHQLPTRRTVDAAYVEALDTRGDVIYRQAIQDPTRPSVEVFDGDTIHRVDAPDRDMIIDVTVPDVRELASLRMVVGRDEIPFRPGPGEPKGHSYDVRGRAE